MYPESVPFPANDPTPGTDITLSIDCSWWPYIIGALKSLRQQATWDTDDDAILMLTLDRVDTLLEYLTAQINAVCASIELPISCPYDFVSSDGGWTVSDPDGHGDYVAGVGFTGTFNDPNSLDFVRVVTHLGTPNVIQSIRFHVDAGAAGTGPNQNVEILIHQASGYTHLAHGNLDGGTQTVSWSGSFTDVDEIAVEANSGNTSTSVVITDAFYSGVSSEGCS